MNRAAFCTQPDVINFVTWLVNKLPTLPIHLCIPKSRFVPLKNGIDVRVQGIQNVIPNHYVWRATGMKVGDWAETTSHLNTLSTALRNAVKAGNNPAALAASWEIIKWGGGSKKTGAYPILAKLGSSLCCYIVTAGHSMELATANEAALAPPVPAMNSMLTKVHSLYATDGLPIYDSRVAAAIATLVEMWRPSSKTTGRLPAELVFPAPQGRTPLRTTVLRRYPSAANPGKLYSTSYARWASAKVRLGWLMGSVLDKTQELWPCTTVSQRMRNFEAALFMIGYDVTCL